MKKIVVMLCCLVPFFVRGQKNEGINFNTIKGWQGVLAYARQTQKPIIVDTYATWCGPCKKMDQEVYTDSKVGDYINNNVIMLKVQMDSTKQDSDDVKAWRADAANLRKYVNAYPSFLFFTSEGKYLGKREGFYKPDEFIETVSGMIGAESSYLTRIKAFNAGILDRLQVVELAYMANKNKDDETAANVALYYKRKYIDTMPIDSLINISTDQFIATFPDLFSTDDKVFQYVYGYPKKTDSIFKRYPGYAANLADYIIRNDLIYKQIRPNGHFVSKAPDWDQIETTIANKFDRKTALRLVLDSKISWTRDQKLWNENLALELERVERYGLDSSGIGRVKVNNLMYDIAFKYVDNVALLKKALVLMKKIVDLDNQNVPARLDTYASLLYKAGRKNEALAVENKALDIVTKKNDSRNIEFYTDVINKMKDNEKIWK